MARRTAVRLVTQNERPPKAKAKPTKTLAEAVESGDYLQILLAQRRDIVVSLPEEKGPAKAALHRQLRDISKEIESIGLAAVSGDGSVVADTDDATLDESII